MKKILMVGIAAVAAMAVSEVRAMELKEAGGKVAEAAEKPSTMADVMSQLSKEDQVKFLASVNASIQDMPVSDEEKVEKSVQANQAAIVAAPKENRSEVLAEVFATASLASLAVLNENFAEAIKDSLKSSESKEGVAKEVMSTIESRTAKSDVSDADKRNAAAVLMFTRADESLKEPLLAGKPNAEQAGNWVSASYEHGNYKWLTGSSETTETAPISVLPPAPIALVAGAVPSTETAVSGALLDPTQYALPETSMDYGLQRIPRTMNAEEKWYNASRRGNNEPRPYDRQSTY